MRRPSKPDPWDGFSPFFLTRAIVSLSSTAAVLGGGLVVFSLAGPWIPAADSVGHFRHILIAGTAVLAVCMLILVHRAFHRRMAWLALWAALIGLVDMPELLPAERVPADERIRLLQLNLNFRNTDIDSIKALIDRERPDFITFQEVSTRNSDILDALATEYPGRVGCEFTRAMSVAVLHRQRLPGELICGTGWVAIKTGSREQAFTVVSLHLHWPWPYGQRTQVVDLAEAIAEIDGPIVVAGDFNAAPWSATVRHIAEASRTRVVSGLRQTIHLTQYDLPMPIDHVLLPDGWPVSDIRVAQKAGSDHSSVIVDFSLPRR